MEKSLERSLKNLRIADVELFITAAHMQSLGKSAAFHHLSQSATSTAIKRVEAAFGASLCTHEKRQFRLTQEGELLLPRLKLWLQQLCDLMGGEEALPLRLVTTHAIAQIITLPLLAVDCIELKQMRPDLAHAAIVNETADLALVLDNAPWKGTRASEVGRGVFQLFCRKSDIPIKPVLLPEDQSEVLFLQQSWLKMHGSSLPIKSRIPSWSLIAHLCAESDEVGFLPNFLAKKFNLHSVPWQPAGFSYRVLAIYVDTKKHLKVRLDRILQALGSIFNDSLL